MSYRHLSLVFGVVVCLALTGPVATRFAVAADEPNLTEEQIREFLKTAKVVNFRQLGKGITHPWRLTLSDGKLTHDAAFQSVDERKPVMRLSGGTEIGFRDSYEFNIAAFELANLVGLGDMIPVTVQRSWNHQTGALSWWVPWKWDEEMRGKENLEPPDRNAWNKQLNRMYVFSQLVYDTDRNQGNMLITEDWKLRMIDFTRAFRLHHDLENPKQLVMCDRQLLEKLRQLNEAEVLERTKPHLTKDEVKAVMARRDRIVQYFEKLIAEKGENAVLY
jgi:hypothetical protein